MKEVRYANLASHQNKELKSLCQFSFCYECSYAVFESGMILTWLSKHKNLFKKLDFISKDPIIFNSNSNK